MLFRFDEDVERDGSLPPKERGRRNWNYILGPVGAPVQDSDDKTEQQGNYLTAIKWITEQVLFDV